MRHEREHHDDHHDEHRDGRRAEGPEHDREHDRPGSWGRRGGRGPGRGPGRGGPPWMGPGFGFGPPPFRRGPRAARGDVRAAIVALLAEQPMHGYQIINELHDRTGGEWRPSPGSVYPTLQQLEDEGVVTAGQHEGKRVFSLTDSGRASAAEQAGGPAPWETVGRGDAHLGELRDLAMTVGAAVMQVAHVGDSRQVGEAKAILEDTRRRLYRLLAGDPA